MTHLCALILGAGYAGEGHTLALRRAGVDVIGMASRTAASCRAVSRLSPPLYHTHSTINHVRSAL